MNLTQMKTLAAQSKASLPVASEFREMMDWGQGTTDLAKSIVWPCLVFIQI